MHEIDQQTLTENKITHNNKSIHIRTFDRLAPAAGNYHNKKLGCNREDPIEKFYKRVPPCNQGSEGLSSIDDRLMLLFPYDIFIKLNHY